MQRGSVLALFIHGMPENFQGRKETMPYQDEDDIRGHPCPLALLLRQRRMEKRKKLEDEYSIYPGEHVMI